ncbi:hypothetical protein VIGAN_03284100, partial [Vigna angularis var. angularis]
LMPLETHSNIDSHPPLTHEGLHPSSALHRNHKIPLPSQTCSSPNNFNLEESDSQRLNFIELDIRVFLLELQENKTIHREEIKYIRSMPMTTLVTVRTGGDGTRRCC